MLSKELGEVVSSQHRVGFSVTNQLGHSIRLNSFGEDHFIPHKDVFEINLELFWVIFWLTDPILFQILDIFFSREFYFKPRVLKTLTHSLNYLCIFSVFVRFVKRENSSVVGTHEFIFFEFSIGNISENELFHLRIKLIFIFLFTLR